MGGKEEGEALSPKGRGRRMFTLGTLATLAAAGLNASAAHPQERIRSDFENMLHPSPGTPEERESESTNVYIDLKSRWDELGDRRDSTWWVSDGPYSFGMSISGNMSSVRKRLGNGLVAEVKARREWDVEKQVYGDRGWVTDASLGYVLPDGRMAPVFEVTFWGGVGVPPLTVAGGFLNANYVDLNDPLLKTIPRNHNGNGQISFSSDTPPQGEAADICWRMWRRIVHEFSVGG